MSRILTLVPTVVVVCVVGLCSPAEAQLASRAAPEPEIQVASAHGELQGVVTDDHGEALPGAVVSVLGMTTSFVVTDRAGRFSFRSLPPGPYLIRAHLQGYVPARGRVIQVNSAARSTSAITLARRGGPNAPTQILAAGVGPVDSGVADAGEPDHDHGETAWRLRHLKRSVLKESGAAGLIGDDDDSFLVDSLETIGRAVGSPARLASALFTELPLTGQVHFLTTTSFNQPEELFSVEGGAPRGVAFVSLGAPTASGEWAVRGAMTQGDLSSWIVAGSFVRRAPAAHQYETGLSYSMQRYHGANPVALVAVTDGSRNVGEVYAFDTWTIVPRLTVSYGARYARYDYLDEGGLFSPRAGVTYTLTPTFRMRAAVSRREVAPGAEEFTPRASGVWLPPERTFSSISSALRPERMDHYEVAAEQQIGRDVVIGIRAFRQQVDDQVVTMFGISMPGGAASDIGHYYVASAGDVDAHGWGVSVSRSISGRLRGSVDYTQTDATWSRLSPDAQLLSVVASSALRPASERLHDITTSVQTEIPLTATRLFVLYKVNSGFAVAEARDRQGHFGSRFDVQVNQALPFLDFTSAHWEMLFTVRNLFRDELLDASPYDELLVIKPPKRIVGGLTVRF